MNSQLVTQFVNTLDLRPYTENLGSPAELAGWLTEQGLVPPGTRATRAELAEALRLREAIRDLLGGVDPDKQLSELDRVSRESRLGVRFADGEARLEPAAPGVRGALGRIVAEVAAGMADGTWQRIKLCAADDCRWAFLDSTKNHSRAWCSMESCGNRAKVQAYRARHR